MIEKLKRFDSGVARAEGWLTVVVLIIMVLVAGFAASVRNLTRFDVAWANALLNDMDWADSLLRKGTMWLAFLGASLATYHKKHINIDILLRVVPPRSKYTMVGVGTLIASVITVGLVLSFSHAVYLNLTERPVEYEILNEKGDSIHICEASDKELAALDDVEMPYIFCGFRTGLGLIGIPAETPGAAFQLIVPFMLAVIAIRMFFQGLGTMRAVLGGPEALAEVIAEDQRRVEAEQNAVHPALLAEAEEAKRKAGTPPV